MYWYNIGIYFSIYINIYVYIYLNIKQSEYFLRQIYLFVTSDVSPCKGFISDNVSNEIDISL